MSKKFVYLIGWSEQGTGFNPTKAFATEEGRAEYLRVQADLAKKYNLTSMDGICDETEDIEVDDLPTALQELTAWAERRAEYNQEAIKKWKTEKRFFGTGPTFVGLIEKLGEVYKQDNIGPGDVYPGTGFPKR